MPTVYNLKPRFQDALRPGVGKLAQRGITANQVTVTAVILSVLTGSLLAAWPHRPLLLLLPLVLLIRMALNAIDGMLAREYKQQSRLGCFLNELGDILSDTALYIPLGFFAGVSMPLAMAFVFLALLSEYCGVLALMVGVGRRYDGPMGKSDRAALIGVGGLLTGFGIMPLSGLNYLLILGIILLIPTIVRRIQHSIQGR